MIDHPEQRIIACAALRMTDIGPQRAMAAARRLADPRPLSDLELAYLDSTARHARDDITRDLAGRHWHAYTAATVTKQRTRDVSKKLARLDQRLGDRLYSAAVTTMREALRRAGVKAIVRARTKTMRAAVDRYGLTEEVLRAINVSADELLDKAFEIYGLDAEHWIQLTAAKRRALITAMYDLGPDEIVDYGAERRARAARAILVSLLLGLARNALSTAGERGGVDVPFGIVRTAMRVADGWDPQPQGGTIVAVRPERDATQELLVQAIEKAKPPPDLDALARGDAINVPVELGGDEPTLIARYKWVHDFWGTPATPFGPHLALDGVEYTEDTRGLVLAADPAEWPYVPFYEPGDHESCQCGEEVTWEPEAQGTGEPVGNQVLIEKRGGPF